MNIEGPNGAPHVDPYLEGGGRRKTSLDILVAIKGDGFRIGRRSIRIFLTGIRSSVLIFVDPRFSLAASP
nr:hypothetical protein Q903MT_gene6173 [Picea sitchensis]